MIKKTFIIISLTILLIIPGMTLLAGNKKINVQGKLKNPDGTTLADGSYDIHFKLYETETGGSPVTTVTCDDVNVADGLFHAVLQEGTPALLDNIDFNKPYYMGIQVDTGAEMTPRRLLGAAGYALGSTGDFDVKKSLYVEDNVGIGTTNPDGKLSIYGGKLSIHNAGAQTGIQIAGSWIGDHYDSVLHVRSGGNVVSFDGDDSIGIGTTNPSSQLHIKGAVGATNRPISLDIDYMNDGAENTIDFLDAGGLVGRMGVVRSVASPDSFDFFIGNLWQGSPQTTKSFYVQGGGNIGIGTTGPTGLLELSKYVGAFDTAGADIILTSIQHPFYSGPKAKISGQVTNGDSRIGKLSFYTSDASTALIERMVIDEGNVGIGIAQPQTSLHVNGIASFVDHYNYSDVTLKTNIQALPEDTLARVMSLSSIQYDWNLEEIQKKGWLRSEKKQSQETQIETDNQIITDTKEITDTKLQDREKDVNKHWKKHQIGLIAQEVEQYFPSLVKTFQDGSKAISYSKFTAVLLEAIKSQQKTIEELKKDMNMLKEKLLEQ